MKERIKLGMRAFKIFSARKRETAQIDEEIEILHKSPLLDPVWYRQTYHDLSDTPIDVARHYLEHGAREGRNPSPMFDTKFYLKQNPDVAASGVNPLIHYIMMGEKENRDPSPIYDTTKYLERNASELSTISNTFVKNPNIKPASKYKELDADNYILLERSGEFDEEYYLNTYPDVKNNGMSPLAHYCVFGWKELRNPNVKFNTKYYLTKYVDVANSGMNPFVHWIKYGRGELRKINFIEVDTRAVKVHRSPSIIFITHEASQSGAPAVLLSLLKWMRKNSDISFAIIIGSRGAWNWKFEELAPCFYMDLPHVNLRDQLREFCGNHVQVVYCNTIVSSLYASQLTFLNARFVTHIHEMESVIRLYERGFEALNKYCTKYIVVSEGSIAALKRRLDPNKAELILVKPFIEEKREAVKQPKLTERKAIFGCGVVETRKGFDLFCEVGAELVKQGCSNFKMYWIGSADHGDLNPYTEINKRNLGDVVEWLGAKDYPRSYFELGDLFLLTSREDPFPLVCLEAAECELPVICFDQQAGGMESFVEHDAGKVVPYLDTKAMVAAIKSFLNNDEQRKQVGRRARQKVQERHYVDAVAPTILKQILPISNSKSQSELESYRELIDSTEVISFDIFDTLVTRKLSHPDLVFDVSEFKLTNNTSAPISFFQERMETAGRVLAAHNGAVDDVSIDEIYQHMALYKNAASEKHTEIQVCIPHPLGLELYRYAVSKQKKIYIASDIYLDQITIEAILKKCGISNWDRLFISSTTGKKKDTGKLYHHIVNEAKSSGIVPGDILHIGDNWESDVYKAKACGLKAVRFVPLSEKKYSLVQLSAETTKSLSQIGKIWNGFCSQAIKLWHESNASAATDFYIRLGFELTGPLATMMAMHVKMQADLTGAKKILFIARDGRIIKKAFDLLYRDEIERGLYESCYLHLSRATVIPATFEHPLSSNDLYFLVEGLHLGQKSVSYFLEKAGLNHKDKKVVEAVESYFGSVDTIPTWNDLNKLSNMFSVLSELIYQSNRNSRIALSHYLEQSGVFLEKEVLFVDVGWLLNIQSRLQRFTTCAGHATHFIGCYVGSRERIDKSLKHSSLLFESGEPSRYARFIEANTTLFEILFSAPEASARKLTVDPATGEAVVEFKELPMPLSAEFVAAQKIQMGAEAFFDNFQEARREFFPEKISKDYFFHIFEALVRTDNDEAKAILGEMEVSLGGHHEFSVRESLVKSEGSFDYVLKKYHEYFDPISFGSGGSGQRVVIVTSAGLDNGSTRYRAFNFAESLAYKKIASHVIHAATDLGKFKHLIDAADVLVFQRCFESQGNVGEILLMARQRGKRCLAEIDDLVFPEFVSSIGSVAGGEWSDREAKFVARSYEELIRKVDGCIVSTPLIKEHIERCYGLPTVVIRNKLSPSYLRAPVQKFGGPVRLIYASGTYSHKQDFAVVEDLLFKFLRQNKNVTLTIAGAAQVSGRILALPNVSNYSILQYPAMLDLIARCDLMLVPLVDNVFNRAKSSVKFVESGGVGVPVLASQIGEFDFAIKNGENGLLASGREEWAQVLDWVAREPTSLRSIARNAYDTVRSQYVSSKLEAQAEAFFM